MMRGSKRRRRAPDAARMVVFVHGFGAGGAVFGPMRARIEEALDVATLDFTYRSSQSFSRVATDLASHIEREGRRWDQLDLVGHSLGGLLARWYLQELGGAERVQRLVTLATPHAGTRSARIAPGPLRAVLLPDNTIVRRLKQGRARASDVQHTALVASDDLMVTPPASAAAVENADVRWFEGVGHNGMLFDTDVHDEVVEALRR